MPPISSKLPHCHMSTSLSDDAEVEVVMQIIEMTLMLAGYCDSFEAALDIFEVGIATREDRGIGARWQFVACRDAAMTMYHYGWTLAKIRSLLGQAPETITRTDPIALKEAENDFKALNPLYIKLRHAVAHAAEAEVGPKSKQNYATNSIGDYINIVGDGKIMLAGSLVGRSYVWTFEGKTIELPMIPATLHALVDVTARVYDALDTNPFRDRGSAQPRTQ